MEVTSAEYLTFVLKFTRLLVSNDNSLHTVFITDTQTQFIVLTSDSSVKTETMLFSFMTFYRRMNLPSSTVTLSLKIDSSSWFTGTRVHVVVSRVLLV